MAANIACYYNLANKQGITMVIPVVINATGERKKQKKKKERKKNRKKKLADRHK